ncbi:MAG TPA: trypsin-like serine protease [Polyangia bacterium]|nr:trypsin-like serine protease [Polyangia bacterium]
MRRSVFASFASCVLLSGCLGAPAPVDEREGAIIGGTLDTADPGVVLLFAQVPGAQNGSLCTAEIVSPHVVITAAHCVSPAEVGQGAQFIVYPGSDFSQANQGNTLAVKETHFDPLFDTNNLTAGHDIGVAILQNPVSIAPLAMNRAPLTAAMQGQPVRFVGYGLNNAAQQTGAGVKRTTMTTLTDFDTVLVHFTDGTHETCNGDSGGPAFMTLGGREQIVGLTSFGDVNCNMGGYDTRLDAMVSFVDPYIQANDPQQPLSPPDMAGPAPSPDMAGPGAPSSPGTGGGDPPSASNGGDPPGTPSALAALGDPCSRDDDCQSRQCGVGHQGQLVCVGGSAPSNSLVGGCSAAPGSSDRTKLALMLIVGVALLLSRGLRRRI